MVLFRKLAEIAGQYLRKGSQVYIEGELQTRKWQDKNGIERYTTEIVANSLQMLGKAEDNQTKQPVQNTEKNTKQAQKQEQEPSFNDDGIPF